MDLPASSNKASQPRLCENGRVRLDRHQRTDLNHDSGVRRDVPSPLHDSHASGLYQRHRHYTSERYVANDHTYLPRQDSAARRISTERGGGVNDGALVTTRSLTSPCVSSHHLSTARRTIGFNRCCEALNFAPKVARDLPHAARDHGRPAEWRLRSRGRY
jgi:hypothetical protein